MKKTPQPKNKSNQALISTAFQDHITRQLNLDSLLTTKIPKSNVGRIQVSSVKSKVDTGLPKNKAKSNRNSEENEPREYVINNFKSNSDLPTLAEKLGLIPESRAKNLDESEWSKVKAKYKAREDYKQPCVICKEQLGSQPQVLLSCTHTFHRTCLEVFERFSGKKCCPMCRKERYQTRVVYDASKYYKDTCAARIQAAWRGYLVRKWYNAYRRLVPPQNPALRKKFFEEKLSDITNRLVMSFNIDRDNMLEDIDRNLAESRRLFKAFELKFGREELSDEKWSELFDKALQREHDECSICMNKYQLPKEINHVAESKTKTKPPKTNFTMLTQAFSPEYENDEDEDDDEASRKPVVLLSCSHVFHSVCLRTFEELNFDRVAVCPECRSVYRKKELNQHSV